MTGILFVYKNVRLDERRQTIYFDYQIDTDEKQFNLTESFTLPSPLADNPTTDRILRALHIALGVSYYKTFLPPTISHDYTMDEQEAKFWNDVFRNGLGEFLYKNDLHADRLAQFMPVNGNINPSAEDKLNWEAQALLGIGGGKDSIVAGELLKEMGIPTKGFVLATGSNKGQAEAVAEVMEVSLLAIERRLDPQISEMNKLEGSYNGHVPISLIFALSGCLLASMNESKYVIVANEASASIPQVEHNGVAVNHQWSKSFIFERAFQGYVHRYISAHLDYFSLIRPLSSLAVAKIFANYSQYFEVFTSDNAHFKQDKTVDGQSRWSLDSPKSLSSYILLAPWMNNTDLDHTFGRNFLAETSLNELFLDLLGAGTEPVLDCVGTPLELKLSLSLLHAQGRYTDSPLMNIAREKELLLPNNNTALEEALTLSMEHVLPEDINENLTPKLEEKLA